MSDAIFAHIDSTGFFALIEAARQFSGRTPALAANVAALYVAKQARYETHKISVPLGRIDSELSVEVTPRISARTGKAVSRNTKNPSNIVAMLGGRSKVKGVPFSVLIIGARSRRGSNYNELTGHRWALSAHPMKNKTRDQGRKDMADAIRRMVVRRHMGSGFLQSGWIRCIIKGESLVPAKYRRGGAGGAPDLENKKATAYLGDFTAAITGGLTAQSTIENKIGMSGRNATLDDKRNEALWRAGEPPLIYAIAVQAERTAAYIVIEEAKMDSKLGKIFAA